jgi:hypothetical protein
MKRLMVFLTPLLLYADDPNRVAKLVETMRQLTFAGDALAGWRRDTGLRSPGRTSDDR